MRINFSLAPSTLDSRSPPRHADSYLLRSRYRYAPLRERLESEGKPVVLLPELQYVFLRFVSFLSCSDFRMHEHNREVNDLNCDRGSVRTRRHSCIAPTAQLTFLRLISLASNSNPTLNSLASISPSSTLHPLATTATIGYQRKVSSVPNKFKNVRSG